MTSSALVTGASGFVGSHLTRRLLESGWRVCAAVRPSSSTARLPVEHPRLRVAEVAPDAAAFRDVLAEEGVGTVFHLASKYVAEHGPDDIDELVAANVTLGAHVLEGMAAAGTSRLVNASTAWLHYEGRAHDPANLYAATKAAFEQVLAHYASARGLRSVTLELGDNYGPDDPRGKLVTSLVAAGRDGRTLRMSPGEQELDLTHVDDVAEAFALAAERLEDSPPGSAERFSVLSGDRCTLRGLVSEVEAALGERVAVDWGARPYRAREVMQPSTPTPALPGWRPRVSRAEGLRQVVASVAGAP